MELKLNQTDNDNCRVYYNEGQRLLCFQEISRGEYALYRCTKNGEPEYAVPHADITLNALPEDGSSTTKSFVAWRDMEPIKTPSP